MSPLKIDVVAPPFDGHLNPILGLARILREFGEIRVLTTPDVMSRVTAAGFETFPILRQHVDDVWRIANTPMPVRGRPWMLLRQFRENLRLIPQLRQEVEAAWAVSRPDLALIDFTLPSIGHWAQARGISWWTSHPSPLAIETTDGTPSYLGGWLPPKRWTGRMRDAFGRKAIRSFKHTLFFLFARELRKAGLERLYWPDQTEAAYSNEVILALGSLDLELPRTWPKAVRFVGPVYYTPDRPETSEPRLDPARRNVLVTIGTHLHYARRRMASHLRSWADAMPDLFFHYTTGGSKETDDRTGENWRVYPYLDYEQVIDRFDAVVHHGGAGITYHCLKGARPSVVWPQDYDQFDFAARLQHHGLATRCRSSTEIPQALRRVLADQALRQRSEVLADRLQKNDQREQLFRILEEQGFSSPRLAPISSQTAK